MTSNVKIYFVMDPWFGMLGMYVCGMKVLRRRIPRAHKVKVVTEHPGLLAARSAVPVPAATPGRPYRRYSVVSVICHALYRRCAVAASKQNYAYRVPSVANLASF